jgi:hypothetical protein
VWRTDAQVANIAAHGAEADVFSPVPEASTLIIWSLLGTLTIGVGWWRRGRTAEGRSAEAIPAGRHRLLIEPRTANEQIGVALRTVLQGVPALFLSAIDSLAVRGSIVAGVGLEVVPRKDGHTLSDSATPS